jgi:hypothetical protein
LMTWWISYSGLQGRNLIGPQSLQCKMANPASIDVSRWKVCFQFVSMSILLSRTDLGLFGNWVYPQL